VLGVPLHDLERVEEAEQGRRPVEGVVAAAERRGRRGRGATACIRGSRGRGAQARPAGGAG
jgi:hypothetical protein